MCCRILVVEPNAFTRNVLVGALEQNVWVVGVGSAREALLQLRSESFDVVLCDAGVDGARPGSSQGFLAEIATRWPWVRRVLMSDSLPPHSTNETTELVLTKPVGARELAVLAGFEEELHAA